MARWSNQRWGAGLRARSLTSAWLAFAAAHAAGGAEAKVCVTIEAADREDETSWTTVGASENLIEASWAALKDSIVYGLLRKKSKS